MNTLAYLRSKNFNGLDDIKELRQNFYKNKITVSYDQNYDISKLSSEEFNELLSSKDDFRRRVIFTCSKTVRQYTFDDIGVECNGLILEASKNGWKPLVIPILSPKTNVNTKVVNNWLKMGLYNVYAIEDGTVVNLYYYEPSDKWVISTARGIEMNDAKFNELTYQEILYEIIEKYCTVQEFYNSLDKNKTYTIGFKHPDMHPFHEGKGQSIYKLWSVQQVSLKSEQEFVPERINIHEKIPIQKKYNFKTKNMHNIFKRLTSALDDYLDGKKPNYGYILVSSDPRETRDNSILLLESSLMRVIRNLWYSGSYVTFSKSREYDRQCTIMLNSFLDISRSKLFIDIFPQYKNEFDRLTVGEDKLIQDIIQNITKVVSNETMEQDADQNDKQEVTEYENIVQVLADKVKSLVTISIQQDPLQKIKDIIHKSENLDIYYRLFYLL